MSRFLVFLAALMLVATGACSQSKHESKGDTAGTKAPPTQTQPAEPPTQKTATVSDADGNRMATLVQTPAKDACTVVAGKPFRARRAKDGGLELLDDGAKSGGAITGSQPVMLTDAAGKTLGRVVHPPKLDAMSVIDGTGVAMFRIRVDKQGRAVVRDKASMPVLIVHSRGGRFVAENKAGAVRAYVTGEDDPMVAALLTAEFVEPQLRGLLACDWALGRTKKYVP